MKFTAMDMLHNKPRVWLTRPEHQVEALQQQLLNRGFEVYCEPVLQIKSLQEPIQQQALAHALSTFGHIDASIFISANAVEYFLLNTNAEHLAQLKKQQVFAVGKATAKALAVVGVVAIHPQKMMSSEGLLALPQFDHVAGHGFYIFRGVGGRGYLQKILHTRGASAKHVELYQREAPLQLSDTAISYLERKAFAAIFIGSIESFDNLHVLAPNVTKNTVFIVPSQRVGDHVTAQGFEHCHVSASANNEDMVEMFCKSCLNLKPT